MTAAIVLSLKFYGLACLISMAVAVLIKGIVWVLARYQPAPAAPAVQVSAAAAPVIPEEHVAAISAAVGAVLGDVRIVHIERQRRDGAWAFEGRYAHHASHAISRQPRKY